MNRRWVYMDNAATTRMNAKAYEAMLPYYREKFANASGFYGFSAESKRVLKDAREFFAGALNGNPEEIYFTSGGSESDNWAISYGRGGHIITSSIEHNAVLNPCRNAEKAGTKVTYVIPDENGFINPQNIEDAIRKDTRLISVMMANNEIGTIQDVAAIGRIAGWYGICFHTDAVQAFGHIPIDVKKAGIKMLSISAHKFGGPKGIGVLYVSKEVPIKPFILGGGQENERRSGTENIPAIKAMTVAAEEAVKNMRENGIKMTEMRDYMIDEFAKRIPGMRVNGDRKQRLPGNINISIKGIEGRNLVAVLDSMGICASAASACSAAKKGLSHVLEAIEVPHDMIGGSLRLTLSPETTWREVEYVVNSVCMAVEQMRNNKKNINKG